MNFDAPVYVALVNYKHSKIVLYKIDPSALKMMLMLKTRKLKLLQVCLNVLSFTHANSNVNKVIQSEV